MAYKIVVANQKGGVTKTTTAINMADAMMYMGYRVLLIDLDPQCNSTSVFTEGEEIKDTTVMEVLLKQKSIEECIIHTEFGDIIPGNKELNAWDSNLIQTPGGTKRIKNAVKSIEDEYDYIIMDTPPNLGAFLRNALFAADGIITPLPSSRFALDGLADFLNTVEEFKEDGNEGLEILGVLITMYDQRKKQDKEVRLLLPATGEKLGINIFKTYIRVCQDIETAISESKSLFRTKPNSNGANDYADFVIELLDRIKEMSE